MIKSEFTKISTLIGAKYEYREEVVKSLPNTSHPITYHEMSFPYGQHLIEMEYEFGNTNIATIKCKLSSKKKHYFFSLKKMNHIKKLFSKQKNSLKVINPDQNIRLKIEEILNKTGLEKIAQDTLFEPKVEFKSSENEIKIITKFYLGFDNKENSIVPIIDFYKKLIDIFK